MNLGGELRYYQHHLNDQVKGTQMKIYKQLTCGLRYQIYGLKQAGLNQTEIAEKMGVNKGTISREFRRNKGKHNNFNRQFGIANFDAVGATRQVVESIRSVSFLLVSMIFRHFTLAVMRAENRHASIKLTARNRMDATASYRDIPDHDEVQLPGRQFWLFMNSS